MTILNWIGFGFELDWVLGLVLVLVLVLVYILIFLYSVFVIVRFVPFR